MNKFFSTFLCFALITTQIHVALGQEAKSKAPVKEVKPEPPAAEKEKEDPLKTLEYPEILVTPRASERLELEAKDEGFRSWYMHLPLQLAAGMTYYTAVVAKTANDDAVEKDKSDTVVQASRFATYVGAGWILGSLYLAAAYRPYRSALRDIKNVPKGTKREILVRERLAEESLHDAADLSSRIGWLATGTMFPLCLLLAATGKGDTPLFGALATITSLAPVVLRTHWEEVSERHLYYKKRIYGPVAMTNVHYVAQHYVAMPTLVWSF